MLMALLCFHTRTDRPCVLIRDVNGFKSENQQQSETDSYNFTDTQPHIRPKFCLKFIKNLYDCQKGSSVNLTKAQPERDKNIYQNTNNWFNSFSSELK